MLILLDTNILLRLAQPEQQPAYNITNTAVTALLDTEDQLFLSPQVLQEFYTVATRPVTARGGLGLKPDDALRYFSHFKTMAKLLPELPLHQTWQRLVQQYQVSGMSSYDARIVAFMLEHRIANILTFNDKHFVRYAPEGIVAVTPQSVVN